MEFSRSHQRREEDTMSATQTRDRGVPERLDIDDLLTDSGVSEATVLDTTGRLVARYRANDDQAGDQAEIVAAAFADLVRHGGLIPREDRAEGRNSEETTIEGFVSVDGRAFVWRIEPSTGATIVLATDPTCPPGMGRFLADRLARHVKKGLSSAPRETRRSLQLAPPPAS